MSEALRLADEFDKGEWIATTSQWREEAAAELRKLHDLLGKANALARIRSNRIEELEAELNEQARANGMGSEREARLMAEKAELVEALRLCDDAIMWLLGGEPRDTALIAARKAALAALAKAEESK